jgi:predicted DsbA family dithiol-disulfide isomerase
MAAPVTVTAWSDYVCPWCYIGLSELKTLKGALDFTVDWRPFFLRPQTTDEGWLVPEWIRARIGQPDNPLLLRAKALGITLVERERVPSSRKAHACTEYARANGALEPFHAALIERYWAKGEDLSDWSCLTAAAAQVGLDPEAMRAQVGAGQWDAQVQEGVAAAHQLGIHAVPTFIIGGQVVVQGAQSAEVFRQAFATLGLER